MANNGFVSLDTLVSSVLLGLGDEQNKRFEVKAMQWTLDTIRRIHVNISPYYREEWMTFDNEDLYTIDYPKDLVKVLSVGLYKNGEFWSFTKKPDMSILNSGDDLAEYDYEAGEGMSIPSKGGKFGVGSSNIAYWADDPQHCRILVRSFSYYSSQSQFVDRTVMLKEKGVVVRYKSTGIDCNGNVCVPAETRDLIVQKVIYEFVRRGWGIQMHNYNIELQRQEVDNLQVEYEALMYEPHNFWEFKDSIYGSLNATARR